MMKSLSLSDGLGNRDSEHEREADPVCQQAPMAEEFLSRSHRVDLVRGVLESGWVMRDIGSIFVLNPLQHVSVCVVQLPRVRPTELSLLAVWDRTTPFGTAREEREVWIRKRDDTLYILSRYGVHDAVFVIDDGLRFLVTATEQVSAVDARFQVSV